MKWLVLAIVAYFVYKAYRSDQSDVPNDDILIEPIVNSKLQLQPQQKYYVKPKEDPRVDGADQPWFSGSRQFLGELGADLLNVGDGGSISSYNTKSFWAELGAKYSH